MSSSDDSNDNCQYALSEIVYPGVHDVLCGRGGHAISHPGNVHFRMLVEQFKSKYVQASRYEKAQVTADVVRMWRTQNPPGRFLIMTDPSKGDASRWHDIGDKGASKKVAQCLRERNPRADYATTAAAAAAANSSAAVAAAAASDPTVGTAMAATPEIAASVTASSSDMSQGMAGDTPAAAPAPTCPTSMMLAPSGHSIEWKQRKQQHQNQRKHPDHHHPKETSAKKQDLKSPVHVPQSASTRHHHMHHRHHGTQPKSTRLVRQHAQRQQKQQNALKQQARQVQIQVEQAEQEVWEAQQQVNQQAHHLQEALKQRAQHEAAAAQQAVLTQQVQQQSMNQQAAVVAFNQQVQQGLMQGQQQSMTTNEQEPPENEQDDDLNEQREEEQSDTVSILGSPLMWDSTPRGRPRDGEESNDCSPERQNRRHSLDRNGPLSARDSVAMSMPSAANLTKHAFDYEPTNGSSDSSTATSATAMAKMTKMLYSGLESFSDTSSENNSESGDGSAISDGCSSIARSSAYAPD